MPRKAAVSVIMPVRNGERWLAAAVQSVLGQTLSELELLVVDDGSTDGTLAILDRYGRRDSRVRVLQQEPQGIAAALNRGLAETRAPLVARLDADDIAAPKRLSEQVRFITEHPGVVLLGTWALEIDEEGSVKGGRRPETDGQRLARILERTNPFVHSSVMFRREVVCQAGGYRTAFEGAEDYDLWLRLAEVGEVRNVPDFLVSYRLRPANSRRRSPIGELFAQRLARRAAQARRGTGQDPASRLQHVPHWRAPEAERSFYSEDAQVCRVLEAFSGPEPAGTAEGLRSLVRRAARLSHTECRVAQLGLARLLAAGTATRLPKGRLWLALFRLHPSRAICLAGKALLGTSRPG